MKNTCLHDKHLSLGALMAPFAGFDMPISYRGIEDEHNAVRNKVGVFDVSHMGEILIAGNDATEFVNLIFTGDVEQLDAGKVMYGMMLNERGGTIDDLLVYKIGPVRYFLVVNASNIDKDYEWITSHAEKFDVAVENQSDSYAELAVQGPDAEQTMASVLGIDTSDLSFYTFKEIASDGSALPVIVSRTGYTGEDGFEIYASPALIVSFWDKLMEAGVEPCGLGCRDTLRFEAGLPLYGDELTEDITPHEAALSMFAKTQKPGFIGRKALLQAKEEGLRRKIVGLEIEGRAIARHGYDVMNANGDCVGKVTTGYHSITLDKNLAMAMVDIEHTAPGTELSVQVRRKVFPAKVIKKRFYTPNYHKN